MEAYINEIYDMIDHALLNKPYNKPVKNQKELIKIIIENGLTGILYETISDQLKDDIFSAYFKKSYMQYIAKDIKQRLVISRLNQLFEQNQIQHIFLKGSHLKSFYPKSYMRAMGDIDVLVQTHKFKTAKKILKDHGYRLISKYYYHDTYESEEGIQIELHPFIEHEFKNTYGDFFSYPFDYVMPSKTYQKQFTPAFEAVYLLYHLDKHIHHGGIGLRSILDIYIFLLKQNMDEKTLYQYLKQTNLLRFYEIIVNIHNQYLTNKVNIKSETNLVLNDDDYMELLLYFMKSGIHGKAVGHDPFKSHLASNHAEKHPFKYLLKVLFPSYKKVSHQSNLIKYVPILLPIYWLWRIMRLLIFKTSSSFAKLKQLRRKKDINQEIEIYRKLKL